MSNKIKSRPRSLVDMDLVTARIAVDDLAYKYIPKKLWPTYAKARRLEVILGEFLQTRSKEFSWKKLHNKGMLCKADYESFAVELQGLNPDAYSSKRRSRQK